MFGFRFVRRKGLVATISCCLQLIFANHTTVTSPLAPTPETSVRRRPRTQAAPMPPYRQPAQSPQAPTEKGSGWCSRIQSPQWKVSPVFSRLITSSRTLSATAYAGKLYVTMIFVWETYDMPGQLCIEGQDTDLHGVSHRHRVYVQEQMCIY